MKKSRLVLAIVALAVLAALVVWGRDRIHFNFAVFRAQLAMVDRVRVGIGFACICCAYLFRSVRWALLLRHNKKVPLFSLLGTQVIGFTAVALIGRVADPVRAYLVAKRTGLPLANQVAVYIVERLFDAGSMALIFSCAMISVPTAEIMHAMHPSAAGHPASHPLLASLLVRYGGLALTVIGGAVLLLIRVSGNLVAGFCERVFGLISRKLGQSIGHKVRAFHAGLDTMRSAGDLAAVVSVSLAMWALIALAYMECCRAIVTAPELASISVPKSVLLMIASGGASIIQLPILGWFSQIGIVAVALAAVLGVGQEAATACATTLLVVTFLGIVPIGLVWARFEHVSLRQVAEESGQASEELEDSAPETVE